MKHVLLLVGILSSSVLAQQANLQPGAPTPVELPPHSETDRILVRFDNGIDPIASLEAMTLEGTGSFVPELEGATWLRMASQVSLEDLGRLHATAEKKLGRELPDPRQSVYVHLDGDHAAKAIAVMRQQPGVDRVWHVPIPAPPPSMEGRGDDHMNDQGYLFAELGVNAPFAWDLGLSGNGIGICDIELGFDPDHCDLPDITVIGDPPDCSNHGTEVFGIMAGVDNGMGVKGISFGSDFFFATSHSGISNAVLAASAELAPGSIILIELQLRGPNFSNDYRDAAQGYVSVEWSEPIYDAIVLAVANGLIVNAGAANGYENYDDPIYSQGNDGHYPFLPENDSGAIYVGAGHSGVSVETHRSRCDFSNYGSRVNVQAWGWDIYTTGDGCEDHCGFTDNFGGTSGAEPIVVGCMALLQEWSMVTNGEPLSPAMIRHALMATGRAQLDGGNGQFPSTEHIGPLPDLQAAIFYLDEDAILVPDQFPVLQWAIDFAEDGDRIMVRPGTYTGNGDSVIDVHGKNISIIGIGGPGQTIIDGEGERRGIFIDGGDSGNCAIEGFAFRNGQAVEGGGVRIENASPSFTNCTIDDNTAAVFGGGVSISSGSPEFYNCFIRRNQCSGFGGGLSLISGGGLFSSCRFYANDGGSGGGMYLQDTQEVLSIIDCSFTHQECAYQGSALFLNNVTANIQESDFRFNSSEGSGGAIQVSGSSLEIYNTDVLSNSASHGGGLRLYNSDVELVSSVIGSNQSPDGGGVLVDAGSELVLNNTVFCANTDEQITGDFIDEGWSCFTISCQDLYPRDGVMDGCRCSGDADQNGIVDVSDLLLIVAYWGSPGGVMDFDGSGQVDIPDLLAVLDAWGDNPCGFD